MSLYEVIQVHWLFIVAVIIVGGFIGNWVAKNMNGE